MRTLTLRLEEHDPQSSTRHCIEKVIMCAELESREDLQIALYSEYRSLSNELTQTINRQIEKMPHRWNEAAG